jgi:NAD-dependent deacetylase
MVAAGAMDELVERLRQGARLGVLTGAGVSAASGVPTFRDAGGLWRGFSAQELATPEAFARDPATVWAWYDSRRQMIAGCRPNRAHEVLAQWSERPGFRLVTQNVDGLHERAGTREVVRFHGSIWEVGCWKDCADSPHRWWDETAPLPSHPPPCPYCGGPLRPGVVWFGEPIPAEALEGAMAATDCDVFLVVGTSSLVHPAASLVDEASRRGALTVEVNPDVTPITQAVDTVLRGPAEEVLDRIAHALASD